MGQTTTSYIWDVASGLPVVLQDGTNTYVYALDLISATDGQGDQAYFLYDGLGSTTDLTDGSGNVTARYGYDVFGALRSGSPGATEWLFTGEQRDSESGLYYLRAGFYDPAIGRFLSQDPVRGFAMSLQTQNPYPYVANNPVRAVDPLGFCGWTDPWDCPVDAATYTGRFFNENLVQPAASCVSDLGCLADATYPLLAKATIAAE